MFRIINGCMRQNGRKVCCEICFNFRANRCILNKKLFLDEIYEMKGRRAKYAGYKDWMCYDFDNREMR